MGISRILHIHELVAAIADHVASQSDRLAFGLTCRATWEVAAPLIWESVRDGKAFSALLPEPTPSGSEDESLTSLNHPVAEFDWTRFRFYAALVLRLTLTVSRGMTETDRFLSVLSHWNDSHALFRSLRVLRLSFLNADVSSANPIVFLLGDAVSPVLGELYLEFQYIGVRDIPDSQIESWHAIMLAAHRRTDLVRIGAEFYQRDNLEDVVAIIPNILQERQRDILSRDVLTFFHCLRRLATASVTVFNEEELFRLAPLNGLDALLLDVRFSVKQLSSVPYDFGRSLKRLSIQGHLNTGCSLLLTSLSSPGLESFEVFQTTGDRVVDLQSCFHIISKRWSSTVNNIRLHFRIDDYDSFKSLGYFFQPLLKCRQMQHFRITAIFGAHALPIEDAEVDAWTWAWPHLTRFEISEVIISNRIVHGAQEASPTLRTTTQSLLLFAKRCPHLTDLVLPVDFDLASVEDVSMMPSSARHALTRFNAVCSQATLPKIAARFLYRVFPKLIDGDFEYSEGNRQMRRVADCLNALSKRSRLSGKRPPIYVPGDV